jgi:hypothetical protein
MVVRHNALPLMIRLVTRAYQPLALYSRSARPTPTVFNSLHGGVGVRLKAELGGNAQPRHHLAPPRGGKGRAALGREHERRWRLLVAFEPAQRPEHDAAQRENGGDPFLARLTWICPWRRCLLKSAKESASKSVIERACYLYARHSWPCAAFLGNLQRSLQAFGFIIRTPCANWLVKDQQGKWNATFGWRVITFSVIDFAHEHRASKEHRDRPDLRRARGRRGPGGPNAISPSDVSPATTQ